MLFQSRYHSQPKIFSVVLLCWFLKEFPNGNSVFQVPAELLRMMPAGSGEVDPS